MQRKISKLAKINSWLVAFSGAALLLALTPDSAAPSRIEACVPTGVTVDAAAVEAEELDPMQAVLVDYLSRRYSIAASPTALVVDAAYRAAAEAGFDPLLVLAVISVESRFNPIAESVMGAKGLMQIIPRYHRAKLLEHGGEDAVFDPESNILVGTQILREYVQRAGTLEGGLQFYNGAARDEFGVYAQRVLTERARLEQVLRGRRQT